jgi:mRNA interferase RelE/StbE
MEGRQGNSGAVTHQIIIMPKTLDMLGAISDRRIPRTIGACIDTLANDPGKQGKPLSGELAGYRRLRAAGQRYRIIYQVDQGRIVVVVVATGLRKEVDKRDVYALAKRLIRLGLLESS